MGERGDTISDKCGSYSIKENQSRNLVGHSSLQASLHSPQHCALGSIWSPRPEMRLSQPMVLCP